MDLSTLSSLIPAQITLGSALKFIAAIIAGAIILSLIFRLLFGRKSALNQAICAGIGVLCIYILTIAVYTFNPGNLEQFLVPLPFVKFSGEYLYLMSFESSEFTVICSQILSMVILVFLYNIADAVLPDGDDTALPLWFIWRFVTIVAAMLIHYLITGITNSFLPELLVSYGPMILLICLVASLLGGLLSLVLGLVAAAVNPILGLLFTFFFGNKIGRQLSKAILTTAILSALTALLGHWNYHVIAISADALMSYIPMLAALTALWYVIGRKL